MLFSDTWLEPVAAVALTETVTELAAAMTAAGMVYTVFPALQAPVAGAMTDEAGFMAPAKVIVKVLVGVSGVPMGGLKVTGSAFTAAVVVTPTPPPPVAAVPLPPPPPPQPGNDMTRIDTTKDIPTSAEIDFFNIEFPFSLVLFLIE